MAEWIACKDFIDADVIRWRETIWERRSRKGKPVKIGARTVTAQVLRENDGNGWVRLVVSNCEITERFTTKNTGHLKKDAEIKRKRDTITRGKPERLLWSDEGNRDNLVAERAAKPRGPKPRDGKPPRRGT